MSKQFAKLDTSIFVSLLLILYTLTSGLPGLYFNLWIARFKGKGVYFLKADYDNKVDFTLEKYRENL